LHRVDAARDHRETVGEIGCCQSIGDEISRRADISGEDSRQPDCLLEGIDAQVGRGPPRRQPPGDRGFARPGQAAENDQDNHPAVAAVFPGLI
jgi:hypothetical protein